MLLENKHAVIYGAGGTVGAAVARAFAREGAWVSLAGRTRTKLDRLAQDISAASGNVAGIAQVDALDVQAVEQHVGRLAEDVGALDICFNAVGDEATLGQPLLDIPFAEFIRPITRLVTAQFLIAKAVARYMIQRNSGVILTMTGSGLPMAGMGGAMTGWAAVDALCGQLARELGPHGVRVLWLQTTGLPEALTVDRFPAYGTGREGGMTRDELVDWLRGKTMLKRLTTLEEVGNAAAFLASDRAGAMTGSGANLTGGSVFG